MKNLLIIDDDVAYRRLLASWLQENGWNVLEADDGEAGLNLAFEHRPEIVVCDLMMPRCNGFQVCRTLRRHRDRLPNTSIVITSGSAYETDRINALEAGADRYLLKPVSPAELVRLLSEIIQQPGLGREAVEAVSRADGQQVRLKFWGVRGSIPTPGPKTVFYGGNTSCVELRAGGEIIILDAGTGIRPLGLRLQQEFKDQPISATILITHSHWDHIQGFPFFGPAYNSRNRIRILGFEGARQGLQSTLLGQMESPYFPIKMQELPGYIEVLELRDMDFSVGSVPVRAAFMNHPGVCAGYRFSTAGGAVCYMPDVELVPRLNASSPGEAHQDEAGRLKFAEDQHRKMIEFVRDAEVLILDSQYDAAEYQKHVGWGHSCIEDVLDLAVEANVRRLFLFHHDPDHSDEQVSRFVARARETVGRRGSRLLVEAAREGLELVLEERSADIPVRQGVG